MILKNLILLQSNLDNSNGNEENFRLIEVSELSRFDCILFMDNPFALLIVSASKFSFK